MSRRGYVMSRSRTVDPPSCCDPGIKNRFDEVDVLRLSNLFEILSYVVML